MAIVKVDDRSDLVDALNRIYHRDKGSTGYGDTVVWRHSSSSYLLDVDNAGSGGKHADFGGVVQLTDSGIAVTGTGKLIKADWSNGTIANRLTFETSTATASTLMQMRPSSGGTAAGWNIYNTNGLTGQRLQLAITSTTGILAVESTGGGALPLTFYTNALARMVLGTDGILTESYGVRLANAIYLLGRNAANSADINVARVNASDIIELGASGARLSALSPLTNNTPLYGRNAANSASVALVNLNASDIMETGATGTRHNLLGTVVAPSIDPPTVDGQVTNESQCKAFAYVVGGGSMTLGDAYNVEAVGANTKRNGAGDFTIAWNRDFSSANYAVQVTVEDNGAAFLVPKVNSKTASSADIHFLNSAAALTDPDAFSVVVFGQLS